MTALTSFYPNPLKALHVTHVRLSHNQWSVWFYHTPGLVQTFDYDIWLHMNFYVLHGFILEGGEGQSYIETIPIGPV